MIKSVGVILSPFSRGQVRRVSYGGLLSQIQVISGVKELEVELANEKQRNTALEHKISALEREREQTEANTKQQTLVHPILGKLVADLGYKKLYLASVESLKNMPMWEKQRAYREDRAKAIAMDKTGSAVREGFPGALTAYRFTATQNIGLLDGQHRLGAYKLMAENGICDGSCNNIVLEVFDVDDSKQAERLFVEINKAEPVKTIDLPGNAPPGVKKAIDQAVEDLRARYSEMFKVSSKCKPPHVHQDTLREDLFESGVIERFGLKSKSQVVSWIQEKNQELQGLTEQQWHERLGKVGKSFPKALSKAKKHNFFLGLAKDWIHR